VDLKHLQTAILFGLVLDVVILRAQPNRIVGPIDGSQPVVLPGSVPFQGQPQYDKGPVDPSFPMTYVTLFMKPTAAQQQALAQLLADQQDRSSSKYHQWITPEQYADSFGLNPADMDKIANWLEAEGFTVRYKARGRDGIAFSGTAGQISSTFHTEIHRYLVQGQTHFASAANPSIPAALSGIVVGLQGLNDFHPRPAGNRHASRAKPNYTSPLFYNYLAPGDIATIYDLGPLYNEGINGAGQVIVVVGQSDIYTGDIAAFRSSFGLPGQAQQYGPNCAQGTLCMILTGDDPGYSDLDTLGEGELDLEWTGAVARNATITYAYSTDAFISAYYAIDNNLGPVISMSYAYCEADYQLYVGSLDYAQSEAQKANSFGITWLASSGDTGAAGCDPNSPQSLQATHGLAVEAPASIPEVTAVGGTEFNEGFGSYWNYFTGANGGTATSYIPEMAWNDTSDGANLGQRLAAGGGGISTYFAAPAWQAGLGLPSGGGRDVPDVALSASGDHDPYIICSNNVSCFDLLGDPNSPVGGTSASTPVFAGILALLNHYLVSNGIQAQAGLGNVNPTLYSLAQNSPWAFHSMTYPYLSNIVPCQIDTQDCSNGSFGYNAGTGYNLATGLGSVDGFNLVTSWISPSQPHISSISPSTPTANSQNQTIVVYGSGFQANLTVTVFFPNNGGSSIVKAMGILPSNSFQVSIGLNGPGTWGLQVNNPHGMVSIQFNFTVNPASGGLTLPDLVVTSLTGSSSGNPGGAIAMSTEVMNQGGGGAGAYRLEFYFSPTAIPSIGTAIDTGWFCSMSSLAPGVGQACSGAVAVPATLPPGTWYLAAFADSNNQVVESNESNNWRVADTGTVILGAALKILGAGSDGNLYSIVPTAGATTLIGPMPTIMSDIAAYNGSLYGVSFPSFGSNSVLYAIDPGSGAGTAIGSGTGAVLNALAFNSSGTLYAAGGDGLYTINTSTGNATQVGTGTYVSSGDLAYDFLGNLYLTSVGSSGDQLFSLNPATGQGTLIGDTGFSNVYGLSYYNGTAYGFTLGGQVLTINLSTGVGTAIASYTPGFNGTTEFAAASNATTGAISGQVTCQPGSSAFCEALGGPISGVTISLSGTVSGSTVTDSLGDYSFNGLPAGGTYTVAPSINGPNFGIIFNPTQLTFTNLRGTQTANFKGATDYVISGQVTDSLCGSPICPVQGLGGVSVKLSGSANAVTSTDGSGNYSFTVAPWGNYTILPSLARYTFSPASLSFTNLSANQTANFQAAVPGDFNGDGHQDMLWQNNSTDQVTVHYFDGAQGATDIGWNWLNQSGEPSGWVLVGAADFDGNGVPDLVWEYMPTGQATVNYYGGPGGNTYLGWNWLVFVGNPGWTVAAVADMNGDGIPDLIWQNNTTNQVTVNYFGGNKGSVYQGWAWLNSVGEPAGWRVVGAADFDGNGTPDLVWEYMPTGQVSVNYYGGTGGTTYQGWKWLNSSGNPGWTVAGASDFNGDGVPDLVWENNTTGQVTVNYYGGPQGAVYQGWNWLAQTGYVGWKAVVPR